MAKDKKSGLSIADIICTLGMLTMLFFLFCGFCYSGDDMQMSAIMALAVGVLLFLVLRTAIYLKKSKPYNKSVWRILEYGVVVVYVAIAFFTIVPIGKFVTAEWIESKKIMDALNEDSYTASEQISQFVSDHQNKLANTVTTLGNYCDDSQCVASPDMTDFINEHVHGGTTSSTLTHSQIDAYRDKEARALGHLPRMIPYTLSDSMYRQANFLTRAQLTSSLIQNFHSIGNVTSEFKENHPYPSFLKQSNHYAMTMSSASDSDVDDVFQESKFEKALSEASVFNPGALLIILLINLFVMLPYIVSVRQNLVRTVDNSGKDIGGRPLLQ